VVELDSAPGVVLRQVCVVSHGCRTVSPVSCPAQDPDGPTAIPSPSRPSSGIPTSPGDESGIPCLGSGSELGEDHPARACGGPLLPGAPVGEVLASRACIDVRVRRLHPARRRRERRPGVQSSDDECGEDAATRPGAMRRRTLLPTVPGYARPGADGRRQE
jgi:hypothetical protein